MRKRRSSISNSNRKMAAQVLSQWGDKLTYEYVKIPSPKPNEVLLQVEACGVGLTVLNYIRGDLGKEPDNLPFIPGHEVVGQAIEVGEQVTGIKTGDRFVTYFYLTCGNCYPCKAGRDSLCQNLKGFVGIDINGGYAEYMVIPGANLIPIPSNMTSRNGTTIPDAISTSLHVCDARAKIRPSDLTIVFGGGGGVGIHLIQMAKLFGARVIGVDITSKKLSAMEEFGADWVIHGKEENVARIVRDITKGQGVHVAIDLVGSKDTLKTCSQILGKGGKLIILTTFPNVSFDLLPSQLVFKESAVIGSRYASKAEVLKAIDLVASGKIKPVLGGETDLENVEQLHSQISKNELVGRGAVILE